MDAPVDALGLIGTTIADKYAVESVVGEGGFAIVYRATHLLWKRPVAVKVFKVLGEVAPTERKKLLDDFIQEGALLADLSERSTAICQARDVGMLTTPRGAEVPYMVLEWLEGMALEGVLASERAAGLPLRSLDETMRLLDPVGDALALAHKQGIAHRDVKPANVFVLGDPRGADVGVKLLDFGIAKVVQDAQKIGFGKTAGHITSFTPAYGAPEQFNRAYGATGPWTDVFALALVTVEVLSGHEPIAGDSIVQLAYAASDPGKRPTPRFFGVVMSDAVDAVFVRALAVQPQDRYQTAGEFWTALREAVRGSVRSTNPSVEFGATALAPSSGNPISGAAPSSVRGAASGGANANTNTNKTSVPLLIGGGVAVLALVGFGVAFLATRGSKTPTTPTSSSPTSASAAAPSASASTSSLAARAVAPCPKGMKAIPGGRFFMGSDQKEAEANEKPPHAVTLAPYCLDEFEVTVEQYKACSDPGSCLRASNENAWEGITPVDRKTYDPLCNIRDPLGRAKHPINCVNWEQARTYCAVRNARLPTEAEWEFAARGSDGRIYPWGDAPPNAQLLNACGSECVAWMKKHGLPIAAMYQEDDGFANTAPVGSFPKGQSSWGIQDIVGNVWEWVADWYADYDPGSATTTTTAPTGPDIGTTRVIRGGSWNGAEPAWVTPAWRFQAPPELRTHGIGFRCAKNL